MKRQSLIYLQGGFGNVLFQIVAYLYLNEENNEVKIVSNLTEHNLITKLLGWKIHANSYSEVLRKLEIKPSTIPNFKVAYHLFCGKISKIFGVGVFGINFFNQTSEKIRKNKVHFGYFQDQNFLQENAVHLIHIGQILNSIFDKKDFRISTKVAVHIRLGDSLWARDNLDYYSKVVAILQKTNEPVTVITDSIEKAKEIFRILPKVFYESNTPEIDFSLLISAKVMFIAPSTFSYWAGIANSNSEKIYMPDLIFKKLGFPNKNKITVIK